MLPSLEKKTKQLDDDNKFSEYMQIYEDYTVSIKYYSDNTVTKLNAKLSPPGQKVKYKVPFCTSPLCKPRWLDKNTTTLYILNQHKVLKA